MIARGLLCVLLIASCRSGGGAPAASGTHTRAPSGPTAASPNALPGPTWWKTQAPCPTGTKLEGAAPPAGTHVWCEKSGQVRHGPSTTWYSNGRMASTGEYRDGQFEGPWELWSEDGSEHLRQRWKAGRLISTETLPSPKK